MSGECWICDGAGCSTCTPEKFYDRIDPAFTRFRDALETARLEGGPVAVRVFCARCGHRGSLATVVRHPRFGLYYEALIVTPEHRAFIRDREAQMKSDHGKHIPPTGALCCNLLDFPNEVPDPYFGSPDLQDAPVAQCPSCGVDRIERAELKHAASRRGSGRVVIHRSEAR